MKISIITAMFLATLSTTSHADSIYKSVDENGNVTYSSTPPDNYIDSTKINISAPPSDADVKAAQQRHDSNIKAAEIMDENRSSRNQQTAEDNRLKRENQTQLQQQTQKQESHDNQDYGYPYYPRRYPGVTRPPIGRPVTKPITRPVQKPVTRPSMPAR